jgi:hypothetical protein
MAHLHFKRTVYKSGGTLAKQRVEYVTRDAKVDRKADRQLRYIGRADREDLLYTQSRNLPAWAEGSALTYFRAAERYEGGGPKKQWNAFEEWKITLPHELPHRDNMALMRDLVDVIAGDRLPITYAFHCPPTLQETREQPHLHLLISGRETDGIPRTPPHHFKRADAKDPARGGARKDPALYHKGAVKQWRVTITDVVNLHLERAGLDVRVHPDRLEDRALARDPEPKLLPSESRAYRETGVISDHMQTVLDMRAQRLVTRAEEDANAQTYWESRKETLGLTEGMDHEAQLEAITSARWLVRDQAPVRGVEGQRGGNEPEEATRDLARVGWDAYHQAWAEGQALWQAEETDVALRVLAREALIAARSEATGVWRDATHAQRPLEQEESARDLTARWASPLLGNRVSKIYHTPGHKNYGDVHPKNQVRFWTEQDAIEAGFRRALNDHYGPGSGQPMTEEEARQLLTGEGQDSHAGWSTLAQDLQALAAQVEAWTDGGGRAGALRVRLHDRERDIGMGV